MAINETWRLAPWADVLYGCDWQWWQARGPVEFSGLRVIGKGEHEGCHRVEVIRTSTLLWKGNMIGGGGNGGFQALNLVCRWGAGRIIFLGLDCKGAHWHGDHRSGLGNPTSTAMMSWKRCFHGAANVLKSRGVEVLNASRDTALTAFPRVNLEDVI